MNPEVFKPDGTKIEYDIGTTMSDGTRLSSDIYFPSKNRPGPYPTILYRTPYSNQTDYLVERGKYFSQNGYVVVCQDVRGRHDSAGEFIRWKHEFTDGNETINWIGNQEWCDGNVGMAGPSYLGYVQWQAACMKNDFLKCIIPTVMSGDLHEAPHYQGGAFQLALNTTWSFRTDGKTMQTIDDYDWERLFYHLPIRDIPSAAGKNIPDFVEWVDNPDFGDYWNEINVINKLEAVKIPCLHIGGWYDLYPQGTLNLFTGMQERGGSKFARENQHVIIGPWVHNASETTTAGDIDFGVDSMLDLKEIELSWFDKWLKDIPDSFEQASPVKIFMMGSNEWRNEESWPPKHTTNTPIYLHSNGNSNSASGDGLLSFDKPGKETSDRFTYNPMFPVPTKGGGNCCDPHIVNWGAFDQREIEARADILVYTSETLTTEMEISGPIILKLFASTDCRDTDFTAKLVDVFPDGKAINLCDGIIRGRYRDSTKQQSLLNPGEVYEFAIDLYPTSNIFLPGHRIRLDISCSNFPRFDRNPNTGNEFGKDCEMNTANQTIYHEDKFASHLLLPIKRK